MFVVVDARGLPRILADLMNGVFPNRFSRSRSAMGLIFRRVSFRVFQYGRSASVAESFARHLEYGRREKNRRSAICGTCNGMTLENLGIRHTNGRIIL